MLLKPFHISIAILKCCGWDCATKSTERWQNILSWWLWMASLFGILFFFSYKQVGFFFKSCFVQVLLIGKSINFLHQVCHDQTPSTKMIAVAKSAESSKDGTVLILFNVSPLD